MPAYLPLSNSEMHVIVDADFMMNSPVHIDTYGYARDSKKRLLHRIIMGCSDRKDVVIDHINSNRLDNRSTNLRLVTIAENNLNRSPNKTKTLPLKNVYTVKNKDSYRVKLGFNKKSMSFGTYDCRELAITIADLAVISIHGKFGRTNRPREIYKDRDWALELSGCKVDTYCVRIGTDMISSDTKLDLAKKLNISFKTMLKILSKVGHPTHVRLRKQLFVYEGVVQKELTMCELMNNLGINM